MNHTPIIVALGTILVIPPTVAAGAAAPSPQAVPVVRPSPPDEVRSVGGTDATPRTPRGASVIQQATSVAADWSKLADTATVSVPAAVAVRKAGNGLSISVRRGAGAVKSGPARLTVDYSAFRDAVGGNWASRLRLLNRDGSPAGVVRNDLRSGKLTADVTLGAGEEQFVLAAAPEGSAGDYKATSLSPSGKWHVSTQSGAFSWGYGLKTPPVPGELAPELLAAYNSQSVDGKTASTNSQPSWLGEGWSLWSGFIERGYKSCAEDHGGNNGPTKTGDLCWETENATISLGGTSGDLVPTADGWRLKEDDGTRIQRIFSPNEQWKVTTTDGTRYFFGRRADSAWTVPVFGNDEREPCYQAGNFDGSQCEQVYRWNLDYVVDRQGNSMSFFYREETNLYGANLGRRGASYTRGGTLEKIEYGTRDGVAGQAPARVLFDVADRCLANCGVHNGGSWPDVPWDQECTSGNCIGKSSPTFWSTKRLAKVTTQISTGGGNYHTVDEWTFGHGFPSPGDGSSAGLWLTGISRSDLPPVTFTGRMYANRVNFVADGMPALNKNRITTITTESGGAVNVHYALADCAPGALPAADTNAKRCFPVRWAMPPATTPRDDWFHKYVVAKVVEDDQDNDSGNQETNYDYVDGAAWAFDDNPLIPEDKRTWSDWRGFGKVVVRKGNEPNKPQSWTQHQYFRGMHGDKGRTTPVEVVDSRGVRLLDEPQYSGFERETIVRNGVGGDEVTAEIHTPWSLLTAIHADRPSLKAHQVENVMTESRTRLSDGTHRNARVETTYDNYGNPTTVNDAGDLTSNTDNQCTVTTYAQNTATLVVDLPKTVKTVGVACDATPSYPADAITDTKTFYDNKPIDGTPTKGEVTRTEVAKNYSGTGPEYLNNKRNIVYDDYGRELESEDALGRKTRTSYTETNGLTTSKTVTNPLLHMTTTTLDPKRGLPVKVTDPNSRETILTYDSLGRLSQVWKPGRSPGNGDSPHLRFTYQVRNNGPSWVTTEKLTARLNHVSTYTLYDGFLRERQTQAPSPKGGRILADTLYDTRGLVNVKRAPYYHKDAPPGTNLFLPVAGEVPNATVKVYDGAERETLSMYMKFNVDQPDWRTTTFHGGNHIKVTPPVGGTPTSTHVDARGRKTLLKQYKGPRPEGESEDTQYGYTKRGDLSSMTDPAGNTWTYKYDVLGRRLESDDPDHGLSKMTYDDAGQMRTTTDARNKTITTDYDDLGRKTKTRIGTTVLTESVYDTLSKGSLTSSTRKVNGQDYSRTMTGYDAAGRPTGETVSVPGVEAELAGNYVSRTTFAADGSPATTTLPRLTSLLGEETLVHGYDDLGLPDRLAGGTTTYVNDTQYTALGEPTQVEIGAVGARMWRTTYRDDGTRRTTRVLTEREKVDGVMVHELTYGYDPIGNVTRIGDRTAGSAPETQCFGYDHVRRVTAAWTEPDACEPVPSASVIGGPAPYWHQFAYDAAGNRKSQTRKGLGGAADQVSTYTYAAPGGQPHAVSKVQTGTGTSTYTYDAAGNTATRPGQTLTWDDQGLLESVGSTKYVYDGSGQQLVRRDPGSVTLFVGGGEIKLDTATRTKTATRYYENIGVRENSKLTWTVADHHGTSQVAIDSGSLVATPRRLDLFGNPRGGGGAGASSASSWPGGNRGFVGGITNDATGLTRLGAREYDPALGKFLSVDPLMDPGDPQQINGYSYSNNNPATLSDPDGLFPSGTACGARPCEPPSAGSSGGVRGTACGARPCERSSGGVRGTACGARPCQPSAGARPARRPGPNQNLCAIVSCTDRNGSRMVHNWLGANITPAFIDTVRRYAKEAGIDPELLLAILISESGDDHAGSGDEDTKLRAIGGASFGLGNLQMKAFGRAVEFSKGLIDGNYTKTFGLDDEGNIHRSVRASAWYLAFLQDRLNNVRPKESNPTLTRNELIRIGYNMGTGDPLSSRDWMIDVSYLDRFPQGTPANVVNFFRDSMSISLNLLEAAQ